MKLSLVTVCCVALCSIPVLAQKKAEQGGGLNDRQFLDFAAETDMVQANIGQLAESVAAKEPVRQYAQTLVEDQTKDFHQLCDVAQQTKLNLPKAIDTGYNRTTITPFHQLKGSAFDHRYIRDMIAEDTKAIAVYKKEAAMAHNPSVKSYAEQALPSLQKHLDDARALEKSKRSA